MTWPSTRTSSSRHTNTHTDAHALTTHFSKKTQNFTQTHDFITHSATTELAGIGWTSPCLVQHLMSDCIFLSPVHEKRRCLLSRAQRGWRAPQLEDQWGIYSFSGARGGESVLGCVFLTVMGRKNEGASEYFWPFPESQHCSGLTHHIKRTGVRESSRKNQSKQISNQFKLFR